MCASSLAGLCVLVPHPVGFDLLGAGWLYVRVRVNVVLRSSHALDRIARSALPGTSRLALRLNVSLITFEVLCCNVTVTVTRMSSLSEHHQIEINWRRTRETDVNMPARQPRATFWALTVSGSNAHARREKKPRERMPIRRSRHGAVLRVVGRLRWRACLDGRCGEV